MMILLGEVFDNPGSGTWIVFCKCEQNGSFERFFHALKFRSLDGTSRQRVFDHTHVHAGIARFFAQLRHLSNRQTSVFSRNGCYRLSRNRIYLFDKRFLVFESQCHNNSWLTHGYLQMSKDKPYSPKRDSVPCRMGNRCPINPTINLTQVTPSAQAKIKTGNQPGRLWSSTIATSLWLLPSRPKLLGQILYGRPDLSVDGRPIN